MAGPNKLDKALDYSNFLSAMYVSDITRFYCKPDCDFSVGGRFTLCHTTDSERATMTSWQRSIVTFYLGCMVSEITRFYGKPDMTSSWFLHQGALHDILHNGFWKSDHDFLTAFHSNFLSGMHGFRDNEVLLPTGYDVYVSPRPGGAARTFSERILKKRPRLPISVS